MRPRGAGNPINTYSAPATLAVLLVEFMTVSPYLAVDAVTVSGTRGVRIPFNRSQKTIAISKIPSPESNHHRFTTLAKAGEMMKARVHAAAQADTITPKAANPFGM